MDILLGVDAGTSIIKAVALTPNGDEHALATRSVPIQHPEPQWAEQDMALITTNAIPITDLSSSQLTGTSATECLSSMSLTSTCWTTLPSHGDGSRNRTCPPGSLVGAVTEGDSPRCEAPDSYA